MQTRRYSVSGMSCAHCEAAVTEEVEAVPGVAGVVVSAESGRLEVSGDAFSDDQIVAAVDEAGYDAVAQNS
jgi:copper chaperone